MRDLHLFHLKPRLLGIIFLGFFPMIMFGQENGSCAEKLKTAQTLFDAGQVGRVPGMLEDCMKSGFTKEEYLMASKLLIQSLLFEDRLSLADSAMMEFLRSNPEYKISLTDHSSFVHLFNEFKVKPVVQVSFHFGTNIPFVITNKIITAASIAGKSQNVTDPTNLFFSLEAKIPITEKIEVNGEAGYSKLAFTNKEDFMLVKRNTYTETQTRIEIPVTVTYNYLKLRNFTAYGRAGAGVALNLNVSAKPSTAPINGSNSVAVSLADISRTDSRILLDPFLQLGAGIKYKTPGGFLFVETRYNIGLMQQTVLGGDSADYLEFMPMQYVDDMFHLYNLNVNLGYTWILYKPSKLRK